MNKRKATTREENGCSLKLLFELQLRYLADFSGSRGNGNIIRVSGAGGCWDGCDGDTPHPGPNDPALLTLNQLHRPPCNNFKFNRIPCASIIDYSMG